jgi:hypothetical protein
MLFSENPLEVLPMYFRKVASVRGHLQMFLEFIQNPVANS